MESLLTALELPDNPSTSSYLTYLSSLSLTQINSQTTTLKAELQSVNKSLTALALREARSLTSSSAGVLQPLPDVLTTVVSLEEQIPAIDKAATFNVARLQSIAQFRKQSALLARNETRLQELLDIPDIVRECVMLGHYTEASDLSLYLGRIQARSADSQLLKSLVEETDEYMQQMALQLLTLLNSPLKLAMALKVIGFLRRTSAFDEQELPYLFLKGRYDALQDLWAGITHLQDTPERYVKSYVDIFREHVFAIITQYTSIFPTHDADTQSQEVTEPFEHNLLPHFTQRVISNLCEVLKEYVPKVESQAAKNTLLTQILYTSQSLARLGCEFISLVIEYFGDESTWADIVVSQRQMARKLD